MASEAWSHRGSLGGTSEVLRELEQRLRASGVWDKVQHDPTVLYRFMISGRGSAPRTAALIEAMAAWREAAGVDAIVRDFHFAEREAYLRLYPQGYHKVDRAGRPIFIQQLGRSDIDEILRVTTAERMVKHHIQEHEKLLAVVLPACNAARGGSPRATGVRLPRVRGSMGIIDMRGVSLGSMVKSRRLLTLFEHVDRAYFPETMDSLVILGAPGWFNGALAAYRATLSPDFQGRIEIIPGDFKERLLELVPAENLLVEYGGTSQGSLTDDEGPWRSPEWLAAAGLLPGAGSLLPPARSLHLRMAAAMAHTAASGAGARLQHSVMVATEGGAGCGWHTVAGLPLTARSTGGGVRAVAAAAAAAEPPAPAPETALAREPAAVPAAVQTGASPAASAEDAASQQQEASDKAKAPVRPSPFACPEQHIATLTAIHGGALPPRVASPPPTPAAVRSAAAAQAAADVRPPSPLRVRIRRSLGGGAARTAAAATAMPAQAPASAATAAAAAAAGSTGAGARCGMEELPSMVSAQSFVTCPSYQNSGQLTARLWQLTGSPRRAALAAVLAAAGGEAGGALAIQPAGSSGDSAGLVTHAEIRLHGVAWGKANSKLATPPALAAGPVRAALCGLWPQWRWAKERRAARRLVAAAARTPTMLALARGPAPSPFALRRRSGGPRGAPGCWRAQRASDE